MRSIAFIFIAVLCVFSCSHPQDIKPVVDDDVILKSSHMPDLIEAQFNHSLNILCKDRLKYLDTLKHFYKKRKFRPLWWNALVGDSVAWARLQNDFYHADHHGMDWRYYQFGLVEYYRNTLGAISDPDSIYNLITQLELILSNGLVQMYNDISLGRTKPEEIFGFSYMLPMNQHKRLYWELFLLSDQRVKMLDDMHRGDTSYENLKGLLHYYQQKKIQEEQHSIDFSDYPRIDPGDSAPVIAEIIAKLRNAIEPDSGILELDTGTIYSHKMVVLIKRLQEKYHLEPDGILGYKTYQLINTTAQSRIDQIRANMERQRWFKKPPSEEAPFIYVNLPEYRAYLYYPDSVRSMKICIGKSLPDNYDAMLQQYRDSGWLFKLPKNMETPQIYSRVSTVVINPTWTVPRSIIAREMYWTMRRDPYYLRRNNYRVYYGKREVYPDTIKWWRYRPKTVPYNIVQDPGYDNSLGQVKYMFHNPFSIYMHDTPLKSKFKLEQRAVSHGCVRLEEPILFGEFVMNNSRKYNSDDFRIMMGYEPLDSVRLENYDPLDSLAKIRPVDTTLVIYIEKPVHLYFEYRTIWFDYDQKVHYSYDIYDKNKYILKRMEETE